MAEIEGRTGKIPDDELPLYKEAFDAVRRCGIQCWTLFSLVTHFQTQVDFQYFERVLLQFDADKSGFIENKEIENLLDNLSLKVPGHKLRTLKEEYGDKIDFEEFQEVSLRFIFI